MKISGIWQLSPLVVLSPLQASPVRVITPPGGDNSSDTTAFYLTIGNVCIVGDNECGLEGRGGLYVYNTVCVYCR